jgi:hypothetical protein
MAAKLDPPLNTIHYSVLNDPNPQAVDCLSTSDMAAQWIRWKESNPHLRDQNPSSCR